MSFNNREVIRQHLRRDAVLRPLIDEFDYPEDRLHLREAYPALLRSIVGQQVSTHAAAAIYTRFLALFGLDSSDPAAVPTPDVLAKADREALRECGLSYSKADYVRNIAQHWLAYPDLSERLPKLSDEEVIADLTSIKGVGKWTAEMMLLFALGRPDLLPLEDLAIFQTILELYDLDADAKPRALKAEMTLIAEAWRPVPQRSMPVLVRLAGGKESGQSRVRVPRTRGGRRALRITL